MLVNRMNWSKLSLLSAGDIEVDLLSSLDESLTVERIAPHGLDDSAYISSEIEFVPELGMTTSHFDIWD
jgi:hypothetical protein